MMNITLIISKDNEIRKRFSDMLQKIGVPYIFESDVAHALLRILEVKFKLTVVDLDTLDCNPMDFLKIIQLLRPKLTVFAIIDESMLDSYQTVLDAGAKYCLVKSAKDEELTGMLHEIVSDTDLMTLRNQKN